MGLLDGQDEMAREEMPGLSGIAPPASASAPQMQPLAHRVRNLETQMIEAERLFITLDRVVGQIHALLTEARDQLDLPPVDYIHPTSR